MRLLLVLFVCCSGVCAKGQGQAQHKMNPLIIIDSLTTSNETMIVHPSKFISITTINSVKAIQLYGDYGKFGAIRIQAQPNVQWARLDAILDKFNIESQYRGLKVCINKFPVLEPQKILADLSEIQAVEITNSTPTKVPGEYYINIVTLQASR